METDYICTSDAGKICYSSATLAVPVCRNFPCAPRTMLVLVGGVIARERVRVMRVEIIASHRVLREVCVCVCVCVCVLSFKVVQWVVGTVVNGE